MHYGRTAFLMAALAASVASGGKQCVAAEPAHFAVMGVRLYMSAQEVLIVLDAQGVREDDVREHVHSCALHASAACTDSIMARLPDGQMAIRFTDAPAGSNEGREAAFSIVYRLSSAPRDITELRHAAEQRFGTLSNAVDGAWCAGMAMACPEDRPRMAFRHDTSGAGELALTDLGLPDRLALGAALQPAFGGSAE